MAVLIDHLKELSEEGKAKGEVATISKERMAILNEEIREEMEEFNLENNHKMFLSERDAYKIYLDSPKYN